MSNLPKNFRQKIHKGVFTSQTAGLCPGYAQGNLVVLPREYAFEFLLFAQRNPKACPLLEVVESGKFLTRTASGESVTTAIPKYRVYREGVLDQEMSSIDHLWQDDFVTFILGCSFTFESALVDENILMRHIEDNKNVAMYETTLPCRPAGIFKGTMVVSMRPIKYTEVMKVIKITSHYSAVHGAPVHIGNPEAIGIYDLKHPDFGEFVEVKDDEVPVFWACGVTPQAIAMKVKPSLMISHAPGHMLITDIANFTLKE